MSTDVSPAAPSNALLKFVSPEAKEILMWRDVRKSGICFGGSTLVYFLLSWAPISFTVLGLQGLAVAAATAMLWHLAGNALGRNGPPVPEVLVAGVSEEFAKELAAKYRPLANQILLFVGKLAQGTDVKLSLQVGGSALVLSWIAARVSLITAAYSVVFLIFTIPKVYELKKDQIDQLIKLAGEKGKEGYAKFDATVLKKLPMGHKKAH